MTKDELIEKLGRKEKQLFRANIECNSWNTGKYKKSSNAQISKIYVEALKREICDLESQLSKLESDED